MLGVKGKDCGLVGAGPEHYPPWVLRLSAGYSGNDNCLSVVCIGLREATQGAGEDQVPTKSRASDREEGRP